MRRILHVLPAAAALLVAFTPGCRQPPERAAEAPPPPPESLAPAPVLAASAGASVRRRLQRGETHVYALELAAEQYLQLTVEQQGVDVVAALAGPAGAAIEADGMTGAWGAEEIYWQPAVSGRHHLTLTAGAGIGEYAVTIRELRPATALDAKRVAAGRWIAEGRVQRRAGDLRQALASYERALVLWRDLGDVVSQGRVLCLLGKVWEEAGDASRVVAAFERALSLLEGAGGDVAHRALALNVLGRLSGDAGELEKAHDYCRRELDLRRQMGDLSGEARAANNLGFAYGQLAESQQALTHYNRALALWRQIGNRSEEALTLRNRGRSYLYLGKDEQALDDLTAALALHEELGDRRAQALALNAMGQVFRRGDDEESLERATRVYQRSLEIAGELADPKVQAAAENDLGLVYTRRGRFDEALAAFTLALARYRDLGLRQYEALVLSNFGWLFLNRGDAAQSLAYSRPALRIFEEIGDLPGEAGVLHNVARAELELGDLEAAKVSIERAINVIESLRARSVSHDLRSSYFATKQSYYDLFIQALMDLHRRHPDAGHDAQALAVAERARARSLLDNLIESGADVERGADRALLVEEQRLERAINAKEVQRLRLLEAAGRTNTEAVARELRDLLREYDGVRARIRLSSPRYAALTQPRPLTAREIQTEVLGPDVLLLQYDLGEERSYLWAVTPRSISTFELPPRKQVEDAARRAYRLLTASHRREGRAPAEIALAALSEMVLGPLAGQLDDQRLLIVAEGALQYIPFGVLPRPGPDGTPDAPLVAHHELVHVPSASTLAVLREQSRERPAASELIAVVADPVFQSHDPRLRPDAAESAGGGLDATRSAAPDLRFERLVFSRLEADGILALAPAGASFSALGFEASKSMVTSGVLSRYRYVHFATHGDLNAAHPELSRLVLSLLDRQGRPQDDAFLHAHEIYNLELSADLVVLSACRTALGKEIKGEGLVGLTQGFMYAGASRVIVSLWQVNDRATAELMTRFYERLLRRGQRPAAALREAQLSIAREKPWKAPYYWAGFVLQGEW